MSNSPQVFFTDSSSAWDPPAEVHSVIPIIPSFASLELTAQAAGAQGGYFARRRKFQLFSNFQAVVSMQVRRRVARVLDEAHRVLSPTGVFISISFGQPHFRTPLFLANPAHTWTCDVQHFGESFDYFVYVLHKGRRPAAALANAKTVSAPGALVAATEVRLGPQVRARGEHEEGPTHDHMDEEGYLLHMSL